MTCTLHLAPTNDSALAHLRAEITRRKDGDALAPVHLLLPSGQVIARLRRDLGDSINVRSLQFYGPARAVLNAAHADRVHEVKDTAIRRLVHHLLRQMADNGELSSFAQVWHKPGFTDVAIGWLREMKSQGILPEQVTTEAARSGSDRDRQLALLYTRYQSFLQMNNLSDADGLLWLAAETLDQEPTCFNQDGPLFVYGFDQFTPVQLRLLAELVPCFEQVHLYLLWDGQRNQGDLAMTRLAMTRERLQSVLHPTVQPLPASPRQDSIGHLHQTIFAQSPVSAPPGDDLVFVEAPSREEEVRIALRRAKRLILDGVAADEIAILAPKPGVYRRLVETVAAEYDVPVAVESILGTNPAVAALLNLLHLSPEFPWRQTFDFLRSPYFDVSPWLSAEQIDLLDRLTRERPVVAGIEQWQYALQPADADSSPDAEDEDHSGRPLVATLPAETLDAIRQGMDALFHHLTPPERDVHAGYVLWIQSAILGLVVEEDGESETEPGPPSPSLAMAERCTVGPHAERDTAALARLLHSLRQIVEATDLVDTEESVDWLAFRSDLMHILPAVPNYPDTDVAQVRFDTLESGRGLTPSYLFVLGLSEGEFPTPPAADVLYAPQERETSKLPLRRFLAGEDASLWWQTVSNVRRRLTLLRPWLDDGGAPWPASPYWQAVLDCFEGVKVAKIAVSQQLNPADAASLAELSITLATHGAAQIPPELGDGWKLAQRAHALQVTRNNGRHPPGRFEGVIMDAHLRAHLADSYHAGHVWSASRLNRYSSCPFGFFVQQVLKLEPRPDPEEGFDVRQRGTLLHAILERLHRRLSADGLHLSTETAEQALALLASTCDDAFAHAPRQHGFRPGPLWQQEQDEIRRQLEALLRWECDPNENDSGFKPFAQELAFGIGGEYPAVTLADDTGRSIRLRGVIDRIDHDGDSAVRIVDYKSGSTPYSKTDIVEGRSVQTALYTLAAEQLLGNVKVVESVYLHIPSREKSGKIERNNPKINADEILAGALKAVNDAAEHIRAGRFPNAPSKMDGQSFKCARWCDLSDLCQVTRRSVRKGREMMGKSLRG
jgi:ATP-dependent helicase/DNAse subunit B